VPLETGLAGTGIEGAGALPTVGAAGGGAMDGATRGSAGAARCTGAACGKGMDGGAKDCPLDNGGRSGGAKRTGGAGASSTGFVSGVPLTFSAAGASALGVGLETG
jgi:hypothetical protein